MQVVDLARLDNFPDGQLIHGADEVCRPESENVPCSQKLWHSSIFVDPLPIVPVLLGQTWHVVSPTSSPYVSTGQYIQLSWPAKV
jgi:hypothetical protein